MMEEKQKKRDGFFSSWFLFFQARPQNTFFFHPRLSFSFPFSQTKKNSLYPTTTATGPRSAEDTPLLASRQMEE